jgi:23S rRNA G2445 N2-methylase RlmL
MTRRRSAPARKRRKPAARPQAATSYAAEVLEGVAAAAERELTRTGSRVTFRSDTELQFTSAATPEQLMHLAYPIAIFRLLSFAVPRPKALLGDENLRQLVSEINRIRAGQTGEFTSFRLGAAGSDSAVFQRLAAEVQRATGLQHDPVDGDLLLRFRPAAEGWQALLRLSPRPQSVRPWRVCNLPGGLNATIAVLMHEQVGMRSSDRYFNAMCGSGTLLAERLLAGPARLMLGCDSDAAAVACAAANLVATGKVRDVPVLSGDEAAQRAEAGQASGVGLLQGDATATPFPAGSFTVISSDLPWGDAVGSHSSNAQLYPAFLAEARRLLVRGGRLVLLSHEIRLMGSLLERTQDWQLLRESRVHHGGHYPRIYLLEAT